MKWDYAVTWESARNAPLTHRGAIEASTYSSAVGKAIRSAKKQKTTKQGFSSILVIIEKVVSDEPDDEAA